ncbi:MAG: nucleoside deaminase [Alphaproteobacteria bacterium]
MAEAALLERAVALGVANVARGGGPFGAVIAQGERVVAEGANRVTASCDPTAHAEIVAIRAAARALGRFSLEGLALYASCEPCPMCLAACYWAHLDRVVFAADRFDAEAAGFDDAHIYAELARAPGERRLPLVRLAVADRLAPFAAWRDAAGRTPY